MCFFVSYATHIANKTKAALLPLIVFKCIVLHTPVEIDISVCNKTACQNKCKFTKYQSSRKSMIFIVYKNMKKKLVYKNNFSYTCLT